MSPIRAGESGDAVPISEGSGEPRLHEGGPKGKGAAVEGAEAPTRLWGTSVQTGALGGQCVGFSSLFLTAAINDPSAEVHSSFLSLLTNGRSCT